MRLQLKQMIGVLVLAVTAAMLAAAMGTSTAGASEFKTSGTFPVSFKGEGGTATFLSEGLNSVSCKDSSSTGEVKSSTDAKVTITYLGSCELVSEKPTKFKEACPNITTNELLIVPLSKLNASGKTGLLVLPVTGLELAKFTCSGGNKVAVKVKESVICESTPIGSLVTKGQVICKAVGSKHGEQEFNSGTNPQGKIVTGSLIAESTLSIFTLTEKDSQTTTETVSYAAPVEQTA